MQIGLPITGKYRDPESDQYYNHNDVSFVSLDVWVGGDVLVKLILTKIWCRLVVKIMKISIVSSFLRPNKLPQLYPFSHFERHANNIIFDTHSSFMAFCSMFVFEIDDISY